MVSKCWTCTILNKNSESDCSKCEPKVPDPIRDDHHYNYYKNYEDYIEGNQEKLYDDYIESLGCTQEELYG